MSKTTPRKTNWLQRKTPGDFRRWLRVELPEGVGVPTGPAWHFRYWLYSLLCEARGWAIRWNHRGYGR